MLLLTFVAVAALALRAYARVKAMESAVADLTSRVRLLEGRPFDVALSPPPVPKPAAPGPLANTVHVARPAAAPTTPPPPARPPAPLSIAAAPKAAPETERHASSSEDESLEARIGSRWLLYVGVLAIVVGVSYFEKLAIENRWIGETARVLQGAVAGIALVGIGLRFVRAGYRTYGQVLSGCGVAVLYVSTYAAFNLYHLVSRPVAFALMLVITAMAALLADRQRSQSLALVAVGGGFATPFLLPSTIDAHVALFSYEAILIGGTMFLARRRVWPVLNIVSYAFTGLTIVAWAADFYDAATYLSTEVFLTLFCGMYLYILRECRHSTHPVARMERSILWTAPGLYYFASLAILWNHALALHAYVTVLAIVGLVVSPGAVAWTRLVFWAGAAAPLLAWSHSHGGSSLLWSGMAVWTAVYLITLAGLLQATLKTGGIFGGAEIALLHLNGLVAYFGAHSLIQAVWADASAPLAGLLAVWNAMLAAAIVNRRREQALHFVALAFTLLTIAVGLRFDGPSMTGAWAAEGAVIVWIGLRERREWLRAAGLVLFALAVGLLLSLQFASPPTAGERVLVNPRAACGLFIVALAYLVTVAHHRLGNSSTRHLETGIGLVTAKLLILSVVMSEVVAHWTLHQPPPFAMASQTVGAFLIVGAAVMTIGLRRRQEWIRGIGGVLIAFAGLVLLSTQFAAAPAGYVTVLNGRADAGVFMVVVLYALARVHRRYGTHLADLPVNVAVFTTVASLLTLSLLTSEIDAYWAARGPDQMRSIARESLQTIAWASVGGFLIWRGLLNRRGWIRGVGAFVLLTAILRLLEVQLADASSAYVVVLNARVATAIVVIAVLYGLAYLYSGTDRSLDAAVAPFAALLLVANAVTLALFTSEIAALWRVHELPSESRFAREMLLSVTWAAYATVLIVVGLRKRYTPIRYFAIGVFVMTIVKVFAMDLAELDRIYRVLSVIGLGVALLVSSYLYQRFRTVGDGT